jgi:hypothetical protein
VRTARGLLTSRGTRNGRGVRFLFLFGSASIACPQNTGKSRRSGIRHWLQDACAFYEHCAMSSRRFTLRGIGPGSLDGIAKCFGRAFDKEDCGLIIQLMRVSGSELSQVATGEEPPTLRSFGVDRPMDLIDYQSVFCEVDKYSRVAHPELNYLSKQKREKIKRTYSVNPGEVRLLPRPQFPSRW